MYQQLPVDELDSGATQFEKSRARSGSSRLIVSHRSERVFAKCGVQSDESSGRDFNPRMSRVRTNNKTESGRTGS